MPANRITPLLRREPLGAEYFLLHFRHAEAAHEARPGQFLMIKAGLSAEPPLRRPFSILSADPTDDSVSLFVKAVGQGSRALCALAPGDAAQCLGPLGRPFSPPAEDGETILVAGGYGVAPFYFLGRSLAGRARLRLFYGGRAAADLPLAAMLARLGIPIVLATEDGSVGEAGRVTEPLERHLDQASRPVRLYACGPEGMMHAVARIAALRGIEAEVSLDPWMGCGVGTCLGCVVRIQAGGDGRPKYRCACTEGPVFDAARVVWPGDETSRARRLAIGAGDAAGAHE